MASLTRKIFVSYPSGQEQQVSSLYWEFDFVPGETSVGDLLKTARSHFGKPCLFYSELPARLSKPINWTYVGGDHWADSCGRLGPREYLQKRDSTTGAALENLASDLFAGMEQSKARFKPDEEYLANGDTIYFSIDGTLRKVITHMSGWGAALDQKLEEFHSVTGGVKMEEFPVPKEQTFSLRVKTLTGKTLTLPMVSSLTTTADLKNRISDQEGIPADQQRLFIQGKELEDEKDMWFYKIQSESIIHLVLRLRGGMFHPSSARVDFQELALHDKRTYSIKVILPDGRSEILELNPWDKVCQLKELALAFVQNVQDAKSNRCDKFNKKAVEGGRKKLKELHNLEKKITVLRSSLFDAEEEVKKSSERLFDFEMRKERMLREGLAAAPRPRMLELDGQIDEIRSNLFNETKKRDNLRESLIKAQLDKEKASRELTSAGN